MKELTEKNLIAYFLSDRDQEFWIDQPPGKGPEIGIKVCGMANTNTQGSSKEGLGVS